MQAMLSNQTMSYNQSFIKFLKSFSFAFGGLLTCIREERNFRFHMAVAFHLFIYLPFFKLNRSELCIIIILCALVFVSEAINTAVENAVNSTGIISPFAGSAKDCAAAAVLISALSAVICGLILLWKPWAFSAILHFFMHYPIFIILQILSIAFWIWFVFIWNHKRHEFY